MKVSIIATVLTVLQALVAFRVFRRMATTANGSKVRRVEDKGMEAQVSVLVPVLNEANRIWPCLNRLMLQGPEVAEIIVVDGGSTDGTQSLLEQLAKTDPRVRLVDASPVPRLVNGKAHGLQAGYAASNPAVPWVLTIDADVRPRAGLVSSLLAHARQERLSAFSIATRQRLSGAAEGILHPAMLATLVYRFGIPGQATTNIERIQANGQCFLLKRDVLEEVGGFTALQQTISEDVTLARSIAQRGVVVGFYETEDLVSVEMYASAREAWRNWTRSLPMRDRYLDRGADALLLESLIIQGLPLWLAPLAWCKLGPGHPLTKLNLGLIAGRLGVLAGMARAYEQRPRTYWLSPLMDVPVIARILYMSHRRRHTWRGRTMVAGGI
jgi:dolichol-phosphate mannosyltransferase